MDDHSWAANNEWRAISTVTAAVPWIGVHSVHLHLHCSSLRDASSGKKQLPYRIRAPSGSSRASACRRAHVYMLAFDKQCAPNTVNNAPNISQWLSYAYIVFGNSSCINNCNGICIKFREVSHVKLSALRATVQVVVCIVHVSSNLIAVKLGISPDQGSVGEWSKALCNPPSSIFLTSLSLLFLSSSLPLWIHLLFAMYIYLFGCQCAPTESDSCRGRKKHGGIYPGLWEIGVVEIEQKYGVDNATFRGVN